MRRPPLWAAPVPVLLLLPLVSVVLHLQLTLPCADYGTRAYCWDVVNEAIADGGNASEILKPSFPWYPVSARASLSHSDPEFLDVALNPGHLIERPCSRQLHATMS